MYSLRAIGARITDVSPISGDKQLLSQGTTWLIATMVTESMAGRVPHIQCFGCHNHGSLGTHSLSILVMIHPVNMVRVQVNHRNKRACEVCAADNIEVMVLQY